MKPKYWNKGKIHLSNKDKVLKKIIDQFTNQSLQLNDNSFHALINSIIGQQISVSAANSMKKKLFALKRNITHEEVAHASSFLLSDLSSGITGAIIPVDSGYGIMGL